MHILTTINLLLSSDVHNIDKAINGFIDEDKKNIAAHICSAVLCDEALCELICEQICSGICDQICDAIDTYASIPEDNMRDYFNAKV